eukprot:5274241-Pyramimonas_sp.AAC.1
MGRAEDQQYRSRMCFCSYSVRMGHHAGVESAAAHVASRSDARLIASGDRLEASQVLAISGFCGAKRHR